MLLHFSDAKHTITKRQLRSTVNIDCNMRSCTDCVPNRSCGWCVDSGSCMVVGSKEICPGGWVQIESTFRDSFIMPAEDMIALNDNIYKNCQDQIRFREMKRAELVQHEIIDNARDRLEYESCSSCYGDWPHCNCEKNNPPEDDLEHSLPFTVLRNDRGNAISANYMTK